MKIEAVEHMPLVTLKASKEMLMILDEVEKNKGKIIKIN